MPNNEIKTILSFTKFKLALIFLVVTAAILTLLPFVSDGRYGCVEEKCGFIVGTNSRDGIWFQAIANSAFETFPFRLPNYAGAQLQGYHFLLNLLAYSLRQVGVPVNITYYQIFPVLYFILLIYLAMRYAKIINRSPLFIWLFLFLVFFGMPLTLLTSLYHEGKINNSLLINTFQATRVLESPHTAFSFLILLMVLIILQKKSVGLGSHMLISLLIFLAFGCKFYTASILFITVVLHSTLMMIKKHDYKLYFQQIWLYGIGATLGILLFYNPLGATNSDTTFKLAPFATVHHLIESSDLFYWPNLVLARYYLSTQGFSPRLLAIELLSSFLFIVFYYGARSLGFLYIIIRLMKRKLDFDEIAVATAIVIATLLAIMLVQKGDWFNPMQFGVVAAFLLNGFTAKLLFELISRKRLIGIIFTILIILITFPANLVNATYLSNPARYVIPQKEIEALNYLKNMPDGVVFAPIDEIDSAYVAAFSQKQTYLNFVSVLENMGINFQPRLKEVSSLNLQPDRTSIHYAYLPISSKDYAILNDRFENSSSYQLIYQNSLVKIYKKIK